MKVSTAAVSFLLLLSTTVALGSENESSSRLYHSTECCFTYTRRAIPRQLVSSYYETSSLCSKPGIIFVTRKGLYVCANPHDGWVWDYIKELEE
ncbi:C-C motif chemokine 14-like isoform X3 [Cervus canadensis]|uniref:C-C motif chemokine 14-like isoform X3 n=1 Tax=Cervus canadensis TaxID=1574408 RepID=UPI0018B58FD1|nr:C-C motif chemokine 14-like isoform X3 [Cervus canadensis]